MKIDLRTKEGKEAAQTIDFYTDMSKKSVRDAKRKAAKMELDIRNEEREMRKLCIYCMYSSKFAAAVITNSKCNICNKNIVNSSSSKDFCCKECADDNNICIECGSKLYKHFEV